MATACSSKPQTRFAEQEVFFSGLYYLRCYYCTIHNGLIMLENQGHASFCISCCTPMWPKMVNLLQVVKVFEAKRSLYLSHIHECTVNFFFHISQFVMKLGSKCRVSQITVALEWKGLAALVKGSAMAAWPYSGLSPRPSVSQCFNRWSHYWHLLTHPKLMVRTLDRIWYYKQMTCSN